jgi:hypothetical protein
MIQSDKLTSAINLFNKLLQHGQIDTKDTELYNSYLDMETYEILIKIAETSNVIIKKIDQTIYLLPNIDNELFGFSDKEIKENLYSGTTKEDLYLFQYITIMILGKFYSSTGDNPKLLTHISINDLINQVTSSLSTVNKEENVDELETAYDINIKKLFTKWDGLLTQEDFTRSSLKTKRGILQRTIRFLESENLINYYENEDIIKTTKRCDDIMRSFFLNYDRKEKIYEYLDFQRGLLIDANN